MKNRDITCICICLLLLFASLGASSITAYDDQTVYKTTNHVFSNNDVARGFVRLNNGFTVMPHSCVTMDMVFSVSGGIDLRETSTIRMLKDLEFDSGVTLTTGGNIDGRGHTLILNGDFRIPAGKVLHFNGDTIIDAKGHEIVIGENAEIFVDTNVTLTIANATIKTTRNAPTLPALRCGAFNSKLALDNVVLVPADDFLFLGGRFFIHNDVAITGTSAFVYNSPVPSFITQNSCLYLDHAITFSMAPATFTDAPFSLNNTYTDNNFIRMADETSVLYVDGCTLQTTHTGWRLTTGTVNFDDCVQIKTDPTLTMTALEPHTNLSLYAVIEGLAWHPSGKYVAINSSIDSPSVGIYHFDGTALTFVASYDDGSSWRTMCWSPDGRYLAIGSSQDFSLYGVKIFSFDGVSLTLVINTGGVAGAPCWSPDGRYLALTNGGTMQVWMFDGSSLEYITQIVSTAANKSIWSKDGRHIIVGAGDGLRVYDFDGTSLTLRAFQSIGSILGLSLSPDGRYIGIANGAAIAICRFDGNSLFLNDSISLSGSSFSCDWSFDGRYLATGFGSGIVGVGRTQVYSFDGKTLTLIPGSVMNLSNFYSTDVFAIGFSPNGKYLAQGGAINTGGSPMLNSFNIYAVDYVQTTTPQSLTTSMVFGDSAKADAYDTHLRLMPGASLNLSGKMLYDNADGLLAEG